MIFACKNEQSKPAGEKKPAASPQVSERPIKDYIDIVFSKSGYVLKNGSKLFLARKGDINQLYATQPDDSFKQITQFTDAVDSFIVSPGEKYAALISSFGGNENFDIHLIDLSNYSITPLLVDKEIKSENVVWINDDLFLFTSNEENKKDFFIYTYSISKKEKKLIVKQPGYNIITDAKSPDNFLFYTTHSATHSTPYHYKDGKVIEFTTEKEHLYIPVGFLEDSILMKTDEIQEFPYLELWKGKTKKSVFKSNWSVEDTIIDTKNRNQAAFCTNEEGYSKCYLFKDEKTSEIALDDGVAILSDLQNERVVLNQNRPDSIPRPLEINLKTGEKKEFGIAESNGIEVSSFVKPLLKKVTSFDGTVVPYFLFLPKIGTKPYKTIIFFHGGPEGQVRPNFVPTWQYYLKKGYAIVAPNVRGSIGYGKKYLDLDNYKKRMDAVKDSGAIINTLISEGITEKNNFAVMGGSYGGFMTVATMALYPENTKCGIDTVGVVDFVNFLKNTKSYRQALREVEYGPLSDEAFLKSISPSNMTDKIKGKLLVAHGVNDPRVPISDANILVENLRKNGKQVETLYFDDEGHGFRKKKNLYIYHQKSVDFLDKCF